MKKKYYIEFNADQYQVAQLMLTIGLVGVFDRMERFKPQESSPFRVINTHIALDDEHDATLLRAALEKSKINYTMHVGY